jgi:hypothetical protein
MTRSKLRFSKGKVWASAQVLQAPGLRCKAFRSCSGGSDASAFGSAHGLAGSAQPSSIAVGALLPCENRAYALTPENGLQVSPAARHYFSGPFTRARQSPPLPSLANQRRYGLS